MGFYQHKSRQQYDGYADYVYDDVDLVVMIAAILRSSQRQMRQGLGRVGRTKQSCFSKSSVDMMEKRFEKTMAA